MVFELIGPVLEFDSAATAFGLETIFGESERPRTTLENEEASDEKANLYVTMPSEEGLARLLAMWNRFKKGTTAEPSERPFWKMFDYLHDLRTWSAQDRVDPSIRKYVEVLLSKDSTSIINVEFDLWYRSERQKRDGAITTLGQLLRETGGEILDLVDIPEIRYQGALVAISAGVARQIMTYQGKLSDFDGAMTIRPQSVYTSDEIKLEPAEPTTTNASAMPSRPCVSALLDGYPVTQHIALAGRVDVHEVEVTGAQVPVGAREHGTSIASLVANGDLLAQKEVPLTRPITAVPVLTLTNEGRESTPPGRLAIGVIYRAITSIINQGKINPKLAGIAVINHSLCDTNLPFVKKPSPWATLLDYFSHNHRLLFVLSAGNIFSSIPVHAFANAIDFKAADPEEREAAILNAVEHFKAARGILSPAESVNNLTVGALHRDGNMNVASLAIDPYPRLGMTNLASAVGFGVNRSIKPDLVEHGGRFAARCSNHRNGYLEVSPQIAVEMGNLSASPSPTGDLTYTRRSAGTSNATALVTRACNQIADAIDDLYLSENVDWTTLPTRAPIIKALVTHGCGWGEIGRVLEEAYPPEGAKNWSKRRDTISKFIGYGQPQLNRVLNGAENRVTLLAEDALSHDELHEYRIPMPSEMFNTKEIRSITMTLAYTTPIAIRTADYRGIVLKLVDSTGSRNFWDGVNRILQPNSTTADRGTLFHIRLEGENLRQNKFTNGLFVGVQARSTHKSFDFEKAPYALVITLEMAQLQKSKLYEEVRSSIESRVAPRPPVRVGGK